MIVMIFGLLEALIEAGATNAASITPLAPPYRCTHIKKTSNKVINIPRHVIAIAKQRILTSGVGVDLFGLLFAFGGGVCRFESSIGLTVFIKTGICHTNVRQSPLLTNTVNPIEHSTRQTSPKANEMRTLL